MSAHAKCTASLLPSISLLRSSQRVPRACFVAKWLQSRRNISTTPLAASQESVVPLRKHLKDEAKRKKAEAKLSSSKRTKSDPQLEKWELTVGIEIHAELNTACKLFSSAPALSADDNGGAANTKVALFDAALPGTQPQFQVATLLPALRAAIALDCDVQRKSGWDRKHYFHWDQPNGYQITQYYEPFAKNGHLTLTPSDGVPPSDLLPGTTDLTVGIKQIQMEQDTAKTTSHGLSTYHIDLNRAGHPLIEIITLPHIHSPQTASAVVRKIQSILKSVDACTTGMELGGLRADVNVSIRERGTEGTGAAYSGVSGLGQRTEIKNLSSFKAVEDAIIAERNRQISVLESGGVVEGETRGWTLGASETTRLRGKEGEVDYRYMPDADLPPLVIGEDLVKYLRDTMPELPDQTVERVVQRYGLSVKDAKTIVALDDGDRLEYMEETVDLLKRRLGEGGGDMHKLGIAVGNWVLHELGGLLDASVAWDDVAVTPQELADIIANLLQKQITARTAKHLLATLFETPSSETRPNVERLIEDGNLRLRPLSEDQYTALAREIMDENPAMVAAVRDKGQKGKIMFFVGQMVRRGEEGTVEPETARQVVEKLLAG